VFAHRSTGGAANWAAVEATRSSRVTSGPAEHRSRKIAREVLKERLLLEIREHLLQDLANVHEPKRIGWVLK